MKKMIALLCVLLCGFLCSCSAQKIEVTGGKITAQAQTSAAKFTVCNHTRHTAEQFTLHVALLSADGSVLETGDAVYPLPIKAGETATVSLTSSALFVTANATGYSYTDENGKTVSADFATPFTAKREAVKTTEASGGAIKTRAEVADALIRDIKKQFVSQGYYTEGEYDAEKKQLVIATYYSLPYSACETSYSYDPETWKKLETRIASMSQTCAEEFKACGFDDVHTSVGMLSSDKKIVISATDGEIVDSLS